MKHKYKNHIYLFTVLAKKVSLVVCLVGGYLISQFSYYFFGANLFVTSVILPAG